MLQRNPLRKTTPVRKVPSKDLPVVPAVNCTNTNNNKTDTPTTPTTPKSKETPPAIEQKQMPTTPPPLRGIPSSHTSPQIGAGRTPSTPSPQRSSPSPNKKLPVFSLIPKRTPPSSPKSQQPGSPLLPPPALRSPKGNSPLARQPSSANNNTATQRRRVIVSMRTFWARLSTFSDWKKGHPSPQNLALSGFYFSGNTRSPRRPGQADTTTCFSCGLTFVNWKIGDDPWLMHKKYNHANKKNCEFVQRRPKNMSLIEYNKRNDLQGIADELEAMEIEALTVGKGNLSTPLDIKEKLDYFVFINSNIFVQRQDLLQHTEELASFLLRLASSEKNGPTSASSKSPTPTKVKGNNSKKNNNKDKKSKQAAASPLSTGSPSRPRSRTEDNVAIKRTKEKEKEKEKAKNNSKQKKQQQKEELAKKTEEKNNEIKRMREIEIAKLRRKAEEEKEKEKEREREREREKEILRELEYQKKRQQEREQERQQLLLQEKEKKMEDDIAFFFSYSTEEDNHAPSSNKDVPPLSNHKRTNTIPQLQQQPEGEQKGKERETKHNRISSREKGRDRILFIDVEEGEGSRNNYNGIADERKKTEGSILLDISSPSSVTDTTKTTSEFTGGYMQDMIFTTEVEDEPLLHSSHSDVVVAAVEGKENKNNPYMILKEYVTESCLQIRGEDEDDDDDDDDDDYNSSSDNSDDDDYTDSTTVTSTMDSSMDSSLDDSTTANSSFSTEDGCYSPRSSGRSRKSRRDSSRKRYHRNNNNNHHHRRRRHDDSLPSNYREIDFTELLLLDRIGHGSFATVWKGQWRGANVAVKILHEVDLFNRKVVAEFRREAATMQLVGNHPNVVKFIGVCSKSSSNLCLVSEYCHYGSLQSLLRGDKALNPPLSHKLLVGIARDAAAGILHLHCERVIHRDIAARNVMVGHNFVAQVGDFGFSRIKQKDASHGITGTIGPIKHMAPEAILSRVYSEKSDAFSFGCLLWEMVARKEPYEDVKSLLEVGMQVIKGLRLPIPEGCCPALADLMKQCWETEPAERPNFKTIHAALQKLYDSL